MLAPEMVHEVRRLLAEGRLSQRRIARRLGISRNTVGAIAGGQRPDHDSLRRGGEEVPPAESSGPPQRCPGCGGLVYLPCRLCQVRSATARSTKSSGQPRFVPPEEPLELSLNREHRRRYEQVRAGRLAGELASSGPSAEQLRTNDHPDDDGDDWDGPALTPADLPDAFDDWADWDEPPLDDEAVSPEDDEP